MARNLPKGKQILAVDEQSDDFYILPEKLESRGVDLEKAATYGEASWKKRPGRPAALSFRT